MYKRTGPASPRLSLGSPPPSLLLQRRADTELAEIDAITSTHNRHAIVPLLPTEPVGINALNALAPLVDGAPSTA
ncbi:hypothetical protein RE9425_03220 [Prescottella equi]|nr:hypothetical protein RE9425_03220 [Prescottella equi]